MKLMIPFTPHLAYECLSNLNCKNFKEWPDINKKALDHANINMVIQIDGKTRDVISAKKDLKELDIKKLIINSKANKHLMGKKIVKTIFVKNKIINYITK